eukprot:362112-Chlamydomonas_euryale.AAC.4
MAYGADAACPYLAYEALFALSKDGRLPASMSRDDLVKSFAKGVGIGILKVRGGGRRVVRSGTNGRLGVSVSPRMAVCRRR